MNGRQVTTVIIRAVVPCFIFFIRYGKTECADGNIIITSGPCNYNITATMTLFEDRLFRIPAQFPLSLQTSSFLNIAVSLQSTSRPAPSNKLMLERCWATRFNDHVVGHTDDDFLTFPGCPASPYQTAIQVTDNSFSNQVNISFPPFFLLRNDTSFYIHCSVGACNRCLENKCLASAPTEIATFTRAAELVSAGPFIREFMIPATTTAAPIIIRYTSPVITILTVILASVIVFLLAIVIMYFVFLIMKGRSEKVN
ncbi:uncharacterized protein LOC144743205 [Ciona intestinalis]